ncbi:hypothetical protein GWK47_034511 [Chionoecetes opilio]|uniref:Uncharacterized protein n=1 Tax=Chionoecetes opilio TaxID=41210 RepID=A0A8J5D0P8_CHIOP|nr:hypothetical protein GWK47_034511 [Chionoecetes opilio]
MEGPLNFWVPFSTPGRRGPHRLLHFPGPPSESWYRMTPRVAPTEEDLPYPGPKRRRLGDFPPLASCPRGPLPPPFLLGAFGCTSLAPLRRIPLGPLLLPPSVYLGTVPPSIVWNF